MNFFGLKSRLLVTTVFAGVAGAMSLPAFAQEATDQESVQETIFVTGSRIPQDPNLVSTSPVTAIDDVEVALRGVTRVEDLINQLPQAFAAQGANVSNGATGTATINLRGLGAARTLVLQNGRRLPYGSPNSTPADVNQIPAQLIDRVDVLTGGASAVYGSDALAGVVNFIMKSDFEGFRLDGSYNFYQHKNDNGTIQNLLRSRAATNPSQFRVPDENQEDGYGREVTAIIGANSADDRGNVTAFFTYRNNDKVLQRDRDYSACAFGANAAGFTCAGSGTTFPTQFNNFNGIALTIGANGDFVPYNGNTGAYNFGPLNYYQRPDERYLLGALGNYEINKHAEVYTELNIMDYSSVAQIAPSGSFFSVAEVNCANPLLGTQQRTALGCTATQVANGEAVSMFIARRNVEGGGRQDSISSSSLRGVFGVRGEIVEGWSYDVSGVYATVNLARNYKNDFSNERLARATDAVRDADGNIVCRSVVDGTDPNCVVWNIFQPGGVTQQALDYLQVPLLQDGNTVQQTVTASIQGDTGIKFPTAKETIKTSFGVEYRSEGIDAVVSSNFASGDGAGQGGPTLPFPPADFDILDVFMEGQIPILQDLPGAESLSADVAFRRSSYSTGFDTNTYKLGLAYAPVSSIKARASYQRAARGANVIELFTGQGLGLYDRDNDPCGGAIVNGRAQGGTGATLEQCRRTGLADSRFGANLDSPAGQYNQLTGGNPNLDPETSDTYTLGLVFTPTFLDGFSLSLDYFDIEVEDYISTVSPITALDQCLETGQALFCDLVQRDSLGTLWATSDARIIATNVNTGSLATKGVDINVNYAFDLAAFGLEKYGSVTANLVGTYLQELEIIELPGVTDPYDCVGTYGAQCGTPTPEWRHKARVQWDTPWNLGLAATWRHFGSVKFFGTTVPVNSEFDAQNYLDLAATYQLNDSANFRIGANNVLDKEPPLSSLVGAGFGNGNTYPQVYDALGRYVFMGVTLDF